MNTIIPDLDAAKRVGHRYVDTHPEAESFHPFTYQQKGSGLTLYGAAVKLRDGTEIEVRHQ